MLTWGAGTSEVITKNLPSDLRPLVNMCLLAKALLSFPLPFYSAAEILQSCLLTGEHTFAIRSINCHIPKSYTSLGVTLLSSHVRVDVLLFLSPWCFFLFSVL